MSEYHYTQGGFELYRAQNAFEKVFAELLKRQRKSAKDLFQVQARGVIRNCFAATPPMGGKSASFKYPKPGEKGKGVTVKFAEGKKQGQMAIRMGINRVFKAISPKKAKMYQNSKDLPNWIKNLIGTDDNAKKYALTYYKSKRNERKKVPKIKMSASKTAMKFVETEIYKMQGYVPAGWAEAVAKFSVVGIPGWIKRWFGSARSRCTVFQTDDIMGFEAMNGTSARFGDQISRQIAVAINVQVGAMEREMKHMAEKEAKKLLAQAAKRS